MELLQSGFDGSIYLVLAARKKVRFLCCLPGLSLKLLFWEIAPAAWRELSTSGGHTHRCPEALL